MEVAKQFTDTRVVILAAAALARDSDAAAAQVQADMLAYRASPAPKKHSVRASDELIYHE